MIAEREAPAALFFPQGNHYWVRLLDEPEPEGGLWVPTEKNTTDAVVAGAGPGRVLASGHRYPMQARPLDRVIFPVWDYKEDPKDRREGFVADEHLVAIIRGPDYEVLEPANDYVLIEPDPMPPLETSKGGILIANHTLAGAEARERARGYELYQYAHGISRTREYQDAPRDEQRRLVQQWAWSLPMADQLILSEEVARVQRNDPTKEGQWHLYLPPLRRGAPCRGKLLDVGPGVVDKNGRAFPAPLPLAGNDEHAPLFSCVRWDTRYEAFALESGGRRLLCMKAEYLCAVEET